MYIYFVTKVIIKTEYRIFVLLHEKNLIFFLNGEAISIRRLCTDLPLPIRLYQRSHQLEGFNTSTILGFVNPGRVLRRHSYRNYLRPVGTTFRHETCKLKPAEETPEAIRQSVPVIKRYRPRCLSYSYLEIAGYRSNDMSIFLAGSRQKGHQYLWWAPDKGTTDSWWVNLRVHVSPQIRWQRFRSDRWKKSRPVRHLVAFYGSSACSDSSEYDGNNIRCRVWEKTAQSDSPVQRIENLLAHTDELKGAIKEEGKENKKQITFSKFLATIKTDGAYRTHMEALKEKEPEEEELAPPVCVCWNWSLIDGWQKKPLPPLLPLNPISLKAFGGRYSWCQNSILTRLENLSAFINFVDNKENVGGRNSLKIFQSRHGNHQI